MGLLNCAIFVLYSNYFPNLMCGININLVWKRETLPRRCSGIYVTLLYFLWAKKRVCSAKPFKGPISPNIYMQVALRKRNMAPVTFPIICT